MCIKKKKNSNNYDDSNLHKQSKWQNSSVNLQAWATSISIQKMKTHFVHQWNYIPTPTNLYLSQVDKY